MPVVATTVPTVAVAMIYCLWFAYQQAFERKRQLRERVAFLLWSAATGKPDHAPYDD